MKRYASRADYELDWHLWCDFCREKIDEYETYLTGKDEDGWHTCCVHCGEGNWYYLEDSDANVLIEEDGSLHHYLGDEDAD